MFRRTFFVSVMLFLLVSISLAPAAAQERTQIEFWMWGAQPHLQDVIRAVLVDTYNESQDQFELVMTFRNDVDSVIASVLPAGGGPDLVYGSGPAFVIPFAQAGHLANMEPYSEMYGWRDRIIAPIYQSGTVGGDLYALPNSLNTMGVFYNKVLFEENGWEIPTTFEELEAIMDDALSQGLYASVTGNKGWRPVNENYTQMFLNHWAGPQVVYDAITGAIPWTDAAIAEAIQKSADWFQADYLAGEDYFNLNFLDAVSLLSSNQSPFFFGPSIVFQFATDFYNEENGNLDELGFFPLPSKEGLPSPMYILGTAATLSINAYSPPEVQDAVASIIDRIMTQEFLVGMAQGGWPGYWGVPISQMDINLDDFTGLSRGFLGVIQETVSAVNAGNFGYAPDAFFPPATQATLIEVDAVWVGDLSVEDFLASVQAAYDEDQAAGLVITPPSPGG
ncbi:MAG: ABC transporter substrate-binding protein [Anaerolineaceae bacterium]|nr:ABC transporter substrate-binding protein [Anaerolineaceae bacterium]MCY3936432.1 ABC transporter substrate-binding protein [Chloroflexota bacterium]MCY4009166.1 ABC transporter substrate-binding protein [Anaerolineaceae bacterium]MCY4106492.1 ABC transporter substrate-binding protein [Chloroflexota bacterium]